MAAKNTYTIDSSAIGVEGGRYKSSTPSGAAKKAATALFKKAKKNMKNIKFCIRETTAGSKKKVFEYVGTRVKLVKPVVREINGVKIVNKFKTSVKAVKKTAKKGGYCGCTQ